jgi:ubiquinone/menaquinone biosynthesis C-methylase UbiE
MYRGKTEIRNAYRDAGVAGRYVDERFRAPLGALLHDRQAAFLRAAILKHNPGRVLEIAPGPARLTVETHTLLGGRLTLVDASAQMLAEARQRLPQGSASFIHGDAFRLPFAGQFDMVYTFRLIRHFDTGERVALYREIARVMKPGALLVFDAINRVVSEPIRAAAPHEYQHFDGMVTADELRSELEEGGFGLLQAQGVQHRFTALQRLQTLVAPRSRTLARYGMECVDRLGGEPLEWIVLCRCV